MTCTSSLGSSWRSVVTYLEWFRSSLPILTPLWRESIRKASKFQMAAKVSISCLCRTRTASKLSTSSITSHSKVGRRITTSRIPGQKCMSTSSRQRRRWSASMEGMARTVSKALALSCTGLNWLKVKFRRSSRKVQSCSTSNPKETDSSYWSQTDQTCKALPNLQTRTKSQRKRSQRPRKVSRHVEKSSGNLSSKALLRKSKMTKRNINDASDAHYWKY